MAIGIQRAEPQGSPEPVRCPAPGATVSSPGSDQADSPAAADFALDVGEPQAARPVGDVPSLVLVGHGEVGEPPGWGQPGDAVEGPAGAADVADPQVVVGTGNDVFGLAPLTEDGDLPPSGDPPDRAAEQVGEPQGRVRPHGD